MGGLSPNVVALELVSLFQDVSPGMILLLFLANVLGTDKTVIAYFLALKHGATRRLDCKSFCGLGWGDFWVRIVGT